MTYLETVSAVITGLIAYKFVEPWVLYFRQRIMGIKETDNEVKQG